MLCVSIFASTCYPRTSSRWTSIDERFSINEITWKMRGTRDCAGSVNLSRRGASVIIARGDRWTSKSSNLFRERITCQRSRKFLVYEILKRVCLVEFVCSWPIWRKVRIPFVGKLETYIERAVYLPGFAYAK